MQSEDPFHYPFKLKAISHAGHRDGFMHYVREDIIVVIKLRRLLSVIIIEQPLCFQVEQISPFDWMWCFFPRWSTVAG